MLVTSVAVGVRLVFSMQELVLCCEKGQNIFQEHPDSPAAMSLLELAKTIQDMQTWNLFMFMYCSWSMAISYAVCVTACRMKCMAYVEYCVGNCLSGVVSSLCLVGASALNIQEHSVYPTAVPVKVHIHTCMPTIPHLHNHAQHHTTQCYPIIIILLK